MDNLKLNKKLIWKLVLNYSSHVYTTSSFKVKLMRKD